MWTRPIRNLGMCAHGPLYGPVARHGVFRGGHPGVPPAAPGVPGVPPNHAGPGPAGYPWDGTP